MTEQTEYRILFVEDDKLDQMAFRRLVKQQHLPYDYVIAESFEQAKNIITEQRFDVIITDYWLGDGTGFDVLGSAHDTPVVFITGAGDEEVAVKALKQGAYDYMVKDGGCDHLTLLPQVLKQAVMHKQTADALREYHSNLETLVRQRTEQLAGEKELLSVTLASMTDAVIAADAEKQIFIFNTVAENLTKWTFDQVQGKPIDQIVRLIDEKTRRLIENPIDKALTSGSAECGTDRDILIARDGTQRPVASSATPIRNSDGATIGIVMVLRDVAGEREIDRMKRNLVSSVSHELRSPLTAIKSYVAAILRDPNMPDQTRHRFLTVIDAESNRLQNLIEGLLELSCIESGAATVVKRPVAIAPLIRQVMESLQPAADKKNIQLATDIPADLPALAADEGRLRSMITNLIDNAIKFTPHAGRVRIWAVPGDLELVVSISDTGIGIPAHALPRIFDRFYRVPQPQGHTSGTGLGLAIVKEIVNMHSGRIEVESEPGKGTTFTVFLPLDMKDAQCP